MELLLVFIQNIDHIYVAMQLEINYFERCSQLACLSPPLLNLTQNGPFGGNSRVGVAGQKAIPHSYLKFVMHILQ